MARTEGDNLRAPSSVWGSPAKPSNFGTSRAGTGAGVVPNRGSDPVGSWDYDPSKDPTGGGIPKDYKVLRGQTWDARGMPFRPMTPDQYMYQRNVYAKPIYTYNDVAAMWGKGADVVAQRQIQLMELGYLSEVKTLGYWDGASDKAFQAATLDANRNAVSLEDLYRAAKAGGQLSSQKAARKGGAGSGGGPRTITSKSYNLTSEAQAKQILNRALAEELGRDPTADEVRAFTGALNAKERANPSVTVTNISADGSNQSSTSTPGNVEPVSEAEDWSKTASPEERKMYQNSQYMDVISSMLGL